MSAVFTFVILILCTCGGITSSLSRHIDKRAVPACPGGERELIKGRIHTAKITNKTIEDEAESFPDLYDLYTRMNSSYFFKKEVLEIGDLQRLSVEEIKALYLYSMDGLNSTFHKSFNRAFTEGKDTYPVFHYWLQKAVEGLSKSYSKSDNVTVYKGYSQHLTTDLGIGDKFSLPGYTPSSTLVVWAEVKYSSPGCTIIYFERSLQGVYINEYTDEVLEDILLIPPTEEFEVTGFGERKDYRIIFVKPTGRKLGGIDDGGVSEGTTIKPGFGGDGGVGKGTSTGPSIKLLILVFVCCFSSYLA